MSVVKMASFWAPLSPQLGSNPQRECQFGDREDGEKERERNGEGCCGGSVESGGWVGGLNIHEKLLKAWYLYILYIYYIRILV